MKKIFLLLLLILTVKVNAKEIYTDYEFKGYTQTQQNDDELNKYEPVFINKFYKLEETNSEYLEEDYDNNFEFKDENDFKIENVLSATKSPIYKNETYFTIKATYNYMTNPIVIKDIKNYENIELKEIEVYSNGNLLETVITGPEGLNDGDYNTPVKLTENTISIKTKYINHWIENLKIVIYYCNDYSIKFTISLAPTSGLYTAQGLTGLDVETNKATFNFLQTDKFNEFLKDKNYQVLNSVAKYYGHQKKLYKFYNQEKKYYMESELNEIEGYSYDPNESIQMYKHYQREKKIVEEESPENIIETPTTDIDVLAPTIENNFPPPTLETNTLPSLDNLSKKNITPTNIKIPTKRNTETNLFSDEEIKNDTDENNNLMEEEKNIETFTKQSESDSNDNVCQTKPSFWFILSIIFIIISIIFDSLHFYNVKKRKE